MFSHSDGESVIVPRQSDVTTIIKHFYDKYKGENRVKLFIRIREHYAGISELRIQEWINNNARHCEIKPIFTNKDELKPVTADLPMERLQVDLVDFTSAKSRSGGKVYAYVFSALDVFSRFLFLSPLTNKESAEIVIQLEKIFHVFGRPTYVQTDQGSEFKGKSNITIFLRILDF